MNDFVEKALHQLPAVTRIEKTISERVMVKPARQKRLILDELTAQLKNLAIVSFDDSGSVYPNKAENERAMKDLFAFGSSETLAAIVDLAIHTVSDTTIQYGPESLDRFQSKPHFRYNEGSYAGQGMKQALDFIEEQQPNYKRIGYVFIHDCRVHDPEVLEEQIRRLHQHEKRYPTTFAVFPIGIGACDVSILERISSTGKYRILSTDYSFGEVIEFLKQFTTTLAQGKFIKM